MKSIKTILTLSLVLLFVFAALPAVGAASEGIKDFNEAAGGKNILMYPLFFDGGDGSADTEGSSQMLAYDKPATKYCTSSMPFFAEWKYEQPYTVERIILRTANDNKSYPRRMGDGWTLSGSNDGVTWTVIYTGFADDVLNENNMCYYVDLPDNKAEYEYYQLNADDVAEDQDAGLIQLSMFILCVNESVEVPTERPYITRNYSTANYGATIIEAPDFDSGIYNETNAADGQHDCRPDEDVQTQYCGEDYIGRLDDNDKPLDGTKLGNIGWTAEGEWVQYTVNFRKEGIYRFDAWVASGDDPPGSAEIYLDDSLIGSVDSASEGWQTYSKGTAGSIEVPEAGIHVIKVLFPSGAVNFQALELSRTGNIEVPTEPPAETEADEASADGEAAPEAIDEAGDKPESEGGGNLILIIAIAGGALVVVIVVVLAIVTKKKKK